jgi:hypothetical protein
MGGLCGMVMGEDNGRTTNGKTIITWWAMPYRITFHYTAQALHVATSPFVCFALILIIKEALNNICGVARPIEAANQTQKDIFRSHLLSMAAGRFWRG